MSVAAIGALYLGETAEAAMVLLLFLIGEQLEGYASSRARSGVKALMDLVPEQAMVIRLMVQGKKLQQKISQKGMSLKLHRVLACQPMPSLSI